MTKDVQPRREDDRYEGLGRLEHSIIGENAAHGCDKRRLQASVLTESWVAGCSGEFVQSGKFTPTPEKTVRRVSVRQKPLRLALGASGVT